MYKTLLVLVLSILSISHALAGDAPTREDKYQGIEITVNINTASAEELAIMLLGVGEKKAQEIVTYRESHGDFKFARDLVNVKGIGEATVEKNIERIKL